jgi:hypothetical protein
MIDAEATGPDKAPSNPAEAAAQRATPTVASWLEELASAAYREKDYNTEADKIIAIYEGGKADRDQFNILYSNTETLAPAVYNSTPRPRVKRRFNDADPVARAASLLVQRVLEYHLDDGLQQFATFDALIEASTLHALVPGRGVLKFVYEAEVVGEGEEAQIVSENVYGKHIPWNRFRHGYGKCWEEVPWVAYQWFMTAEELKRNFPDTAAALELKVIGPGDENHGKIDEDLKGVKVCEVWEIWDKETLAVYFVCPDYKDQYLKPPQADPYKLTGFFPSPKPLMMFNSVTGLTPVPLYRLYKAQAEELNAVTVRIQRIVRALKVRGFYDSTVEGIEKIFEADDNVMVPIENAAALYGNGGGLDKALLLMPIEKLVGVLQQLYVQREQVKAVIYEITGIADIMRGVSHASETLGAQQLKDQWGTLRLKRFQRRVALHVRHCLRILAELAVTKLQPQTLKDMTGLNFPSRQEKEQAQMLITLIQQQGGEPDPQAVEVLSKPAFEDLLELLANDLQRSYRIDIEANSTLDAEATEDKQDVQELLGALGQFFQSVGPMVQSGVLPFDVAKGLLTAMARRYRLGQDFEEELNKMQPPQPPEDPGAELKKLELQARQEEMAHEKAMRELDFELKSEEHKLKMMEMGQKAQLAAAAHEQKMAQMQAQAMLQATKPQGPGANRAD